jgi:hypothetical protein
MYVLSRLEGLGEEKRWASSVMLCHSSVVIYQAEWYEHTSI